MDHHESAPDATGRGALDGLRVVELGQLIAGPFAVKTLAEFGADVIEIEPPGSGYPLRSWRLFKGDTSVWWEIQSPPLQGLPRESTKS